MIIENKQMKEIKELYLKIEHHLHLPNCMGKV